MKTKGTLASKKKAPNSSYWQKKCLGLFMEKGRGEPCIVCGKTDGTVYHHIVSQSRSKYLKFDSMNVVVLCQSHHMFSNEMAAHSTNSLAADRFIQFIKENESEKWEYCKENEHKKAFWTYRDKYEELLGNE